MSLKALYLYFLVAWEGNAIASNGAPVEEVSECNTVHNVFC
jgi:hypothetical protein